MSSQRNLRSGGPVPPLSLFTKFSYGIGSSSESIFYIAFNLFCFFYYVQVLGLSPSLAGFAAGIALVFDAISDPLTGYISDRWRWGRMGRRHPLMFIAAVPLGISWMALFAPPEGLGQWPLFVWLLCFTISARVCQTVFYVPHTALGGELDTGYEQRSRVFAWHVIFLWVGGASVHFFGLRYFFASEKDADGQVIQNGMLVAENYPIYGVSWAVVMMAVILFSAFFTMSRIPYLYKDQNSLTDAAEEPPPTLKAFTLTFLAEFKEILGNYNFRFLIIGLFAQAAGAGVYETLITHAVNYIWQLSTDQFSMLAFASLFGFVMSFAVGARLHVLIGKRLTLVLAVLLMSVGNAGPMLLLLFNVPIPPGSDLAFATVMAGAVIYYSGQSFMLISIVSIVGDIADEHELITGKRREGILYSSRTLSSKISSALGHMLAGVLLSVIAFPLGRDVQPGEVPEEVLRDFIWIYAVLVPLPYIVAAAVYSRQRITQKRHQEILEQLHLRAEEQPAVPS